MQTVVQPVMPAQTTVVIQQGPQKPNNYMVLAVLTTFFCNPIFGIIAWILSCVSDSAYDEGTYSIEWSIKKMKRNSKAPVSKALPA